ncbi:hypothetical protein YC2023_016259 [Brassica napus]
MVSQIVWLGVRDMFTQIAKDVVDQGLDHVWSHWRDDCLLGFDRGKRRSRRAAWFFIKPVMLTLESFFVRLGLIVQRIFRVSNGDRFYEGCRSPPSGGKHLFVHDATSILEFSSSKTFSMLFRDSLGTTETERNALVIEDFS